jgi:predicted house-cleaning NTP pyrophosphatase (Maf/HAM1 superfamily)
MRNYSDQEIADYIATGDSMDKAGAYAIQHPDFQPVEALEGCYATVMGLPVCRVARLLEQFGVETSNQAVEACHNHMGHPCRLYDQ